MEWKQVELDLPRARCAAPGWLDALAISMAVLCGIHCLLMPVAVVLLPILATSFLVDGNFHVWMICFVLPTTALAVFLGCRRHKDRAVFLLSLVGLGAVGLATFWDLPWLWGQETAGASHCAHCASQSENPLASPTTWISVTGGMLLASAHFRNFRLCRRSRCDHD